MRMAYINADPGIPYFGNKGCSVHVREVISAFIQKAFQVTVFNYRNGKSGNSNVVELVEIGSDVTSRENEEIFCQQINKNLQTILQNKFFDIIYERYSLWSYAALKYAANNNIPSVLEVNAPLIEEQSQYRELHNQNLAEQVLEQCLQLASLVICVSEEVRQYVLQKARPEDKRKVITISNGVNVEKYDVDKQAHNTINIGFLGSLKTWHGVDNLITAFSVLNQRLNNTKLEIIGDGPMMTELANQVKTLGLSHEVKFHGFIDSEELPKYLSYWDIAVAPYPKLNNFYFSPLKIFDYMAAEVAIVASNIGQLGEILDDEKDALLVNAGDITELIRALEKLVGNDDLRQKLGRNSKEKVRNLYTWDTVTDDILMNLDCRYGKRKVT